MSVRYCMGTQVEFKCDLDGLRATWEGNIRLTVNSCRKMSTQGSPIVVKKHPNLRWIKWKINI